MKNALVVAGTLALATFSFACSAPSDKAEPVDTNQAISALRSPTGSFSAKNGAAVFSGYSAQRADSRKVSTPSAGGSGTSRTQSLRLLERATNAQAACTDGQSCACPGGGSMTYASESSADGHQLRVDFQQCSFGDGSSFDGNAILLVSSKSILGYADGASASSVPSAPSKSAPSKGGSTGNGGSGAPSDESGLGDLEEAPAEDTGAAEGYAAMLLAARGTVTEGGKSSNIEFALLTEGSYAFLSVKVDDGHVVIGMADDGRVIVRSVGGTWHCNPSAKGYVCKAESGETMDVDASEAASGGPVAEAPSGSSGGEGGQGEAMGF